jgi:hypothetical protein
MKQFRLKCPVCNRLPRTTINGGFVDYISLGKDTKQALDCSCGTLYYITEEEPIFILNHRYSIYEGIGVSDMMLMTYGIGVDSQPPPKLDGTLLIFKYKRVKIDNKKQKAKRLEIETKHAERVARENALLDGIKALNEVEKARYEERLKEIEHMREDLRIKEQEINSNLFNLMNKMLDKG